jgi:hypothetical protein
MTQITERVEVAVERPRITPAMWRVAGGLALAHVVVLFAGFSQEKSVVLTDGPHTVARVYGSGSLGRIFTGGYVESLSFLILLPCLVFLARAFGHRDEAARWASQTALGAGVVFIANTLAVGLPAGAAAVYGAHHGLAGGGTLALVNDVRTFAFYVSLVTLGAAALCLGIAALRDGVMTRWVGWGGVAVGSLLVLGPVGQRWADTINTTSLIWMVWWVGVGVCLIRRAGVIAR